MRKLIVKLQGYNFTGILFLFVEGHRESVYIIKEFLLLRKKKIEL